MSTDLLSLWGAIQRGDTHAIASHLFPRGPQQPMPGIPALVEGPSPTADLGTAEVGSPPIRCWTVRFERGGRSYYDRVEAPDSARAAIIALARNVGSVCAEAVCEITRAEYDRFTRRSP